MRKDVKRSLVLWPLSTSIFAIALCWLAMQADPASRLLVLKATRLWVATTQRSAVAPMRTTQVNKAIERDAVVNARPASMDMPSVHVSKRPAETKSFEEEAWGDVADIESWNDTSYELVTPRVAGIPAPSLDSQSDLFGFEAVTEGTPVLALTGPQEPLADVDLSMNGDGSKEDVVIQLDPDIFFADRPLSDQIVETSNREQHAIDSGAMHLAERPTSEVPLPPVYVAPEAVVADMTPDRDVNETASGTLGQDSLENQTRFNKSIRFDNQYQKDVPQSTPPKVIEPAPTEKLAEPRPSSRNRSLTKARSAAWPVAQQLVMQLDILEEIVRATPVADSDPASSRPVSDEALLAWSDEVRDVLRQLPNSKRLGDADVSAMLGRLSVLQRTALDQAESLVSRSRRVAWLQAAYAIQRRLSVWTPIYRINSGNYPVPQHVGDDVLTVAAAIDQLDAELPATRDVAGWSRYLLLEELREVFESENDNARREVSHKFLARLTWPNLDPLHRKFLASPVVKDLSVAVRPWASGAIDYSALLHQIEKAESNAIDLVTAEVAHSMQSLEHASHPEAQRLAKNIDTYYRNANVRFSLSDRFIDSFLPEVPSRDVPVRMNMLGSRVTGVSHVNSDLRIRLVPSNGTWEILLDTVGDVSTRSVGRRGPAAVRTSSVNPYSASKPISIRPADIDLGDTSVQVGGRSRLKGINTSYDGWPLLGSLVRSFAEDEYFNKAPIANRIGRSRLQSELTTEIDRAINDEVNSATDRFGKTILGPLTDLQLDPMVIDMGSTSTRLIARYRMAGDRQLAAMTPRPRALAGNLFSVQVHQSAINNALEQLVPQNQMMPIADVLSQCFEVLGVEKVESPEDLPEDALIQFAKHRPITVEIEDGKVWITMRIIRLQRGKGVRLRNFIVRAAYAPQVDGLKAELVRNGHLSISGPKMSMRQRLPVRAIFNKVLSPNHALPLTNGELLAERLSEDCGITQFELRDGWIGVSVGEREANQTVASRPSGIR